MLLSRRQIIEAGAAAGALAAMSSPLLAPPAIRSRGRRLAPFPPSRASASTRSSIRAWSPAPAPLSIATAPRSQHIDVVGIADFTKASADPRFYLLDTNSGRVTRHLVAHGRGSDPEHTGFLQRFSNQPGSEASSNGAYVTTEFYPGHYGRAMRVRGLDYSNSNAESRAIVVHSAWYAEPGVLASMGRLGRSEGCFALSHASLEEVLQRLGPGHFLYADRLEA